MCAVVKMYSTKLGSMCFDNSRRLTVGGLSTDENLSASDTAGVVLQGFLGVTTAMKGFGDENNVTCLMYCRPASCRNTQTGVDDLLNTARASGHTHSRGAARSHLKLADNQLMFTRETLQALLQRQQPVRPGVRLRGRAFPRVNTVISTAAASTAAGQMVQQTNQHCFWLPLMPVRLSSAHKTSQQHTHPCQITAHKRCGHRRSTYLFLPNRCITETRGLPSSLSGELSLEALPTLPLACC
jgi:hypothetical protein